MFLKCCRLKLGFWNFAYKFFLVFAVLLLLLFYLSKNFFIQPFAILFCFEEIFIQLPLLLCCGVLSNENLCRGQVFR